MSAGLKLRLARLERQSMARRLPRIIAHIYEMDPNTIVGFRGGGTLGDNHCDRAIGESVNDCATRAFIQCNATFIAARYASQDAPEDDSPPSPGNGPSEAASPSVGIPANPYTLAGIGRRASRAELERMGALSVPPERII